MVTRRTWLRAGAAAAALRAGGAAPAAAIETITQQAAYYHGWPTVARRSNGELLVAYSGGREAHICPFGRVELMRSPDGGRTWSWPEVVMDSPIDDRDAGVLETPAGSLLITTFTSLAYENTWKRDAANWPAERRQMWEAVGRRSSPEQRKALLGSWMLRSTDGGMMWSAPYRVPVNSPHGPVALAGGRLLYAGKQLWEGEGKIGVCESTDDGRTWRWLAEIPTRPGDSVTGYHELHAVETADGRILAQIRNENRGENAGQTLQSESADGGKTWSVPHSIGVWGLPSHLLRLGDGRLLMSYGHRREPFGNQARVSTDHGRTWSKAKTISDDGVRRDLGYPSTVELPNGRLVTVWYEAPKGGKAVLRKAEWSL